ncbi:4Fe-4S binding protein [Roseobacter sp. CCS2]|uniref:4Fe-4S binding protein n=1 Tax=Roseobacter sp. CCS2 TaxID=391593 RepID=UPI0000F4027F|nr:4Fe-4S binding protein [Roseobacter sp. CCS2]EBA13958.1 4Fe-4S ferredoxin, iron-sulfur binding protein [Roseobacter sp. CCS2]
MAEKVMICPCTGLQSAHAETLSGAISAEITIAPSALCDIDPGMAAKALSQDHVLWCCGQNADHLAAMADDLELVAPTVLDLNTVTGWTGEGTAPLPKLAAAVAEALLPAPAAKTLDVVSEGMCLVFGPEDVTLPVAEQLAPYLSVTLLLSPGANMPDITGVDVIAGQLRRAAGALGQFDVVIDALQQPRPGYQWSEARDGGQSACDILLDLSGGTPLFSAHEKREGYLRADPAHPPAVAAAVLAASHLMGTFEKPLYVQTAPLLCAHSRAGQTGCTNCLDLCPTGAISPEGDHVSIDPMICAGCGACSAGCPSGAISYDAPPVDLTMRRVQTLARTARGAGATAPHLLVHDAYGSQLIRLATRHFGGLPNDVVPMALPAIGAFGHAEILAGIAAGFAAVTLLPGPGADRDAWQAQVALAQAMGGGAPVSMADVTDPEALSGMLSPSPTPTPPPIRPMGSRRQVARQAARALNPDATELALPAGAPYGAILVNTDSCTLCLSCVSLCPSGALGDNPDKPQLRFQEDACLQCGLCVQICPEDAITLAPRLDLTDAALNQTVLNEEEPFACVECGTLFGSKSTIDRITEKLTGHSMFADESKLRMIQMCDDCRIVAQVHSADQPLQGGERPRPRTTDDYLSKRRDH